VQLGHLVQEGKQKQIWKARSSGHFQSRNIGLSFALVFVELTQRVPNKQDRVLLSPSPHALIGGATVSMVVTPRRTAL
jgi:hypothetical protein